MSAQDEPVAPPRSPRRGPAAGVPTTRRPRSPRLAGKKWKSRASGRGKIEMERSETVTTARLSVPRRRLGDEETDAPPRPLTPPSPPLPRMRPPPPSGRRRPLCLRRRSRRRLRRVGRRPWARRRRVGRPPAPSHCPHAACRRRRRPPALGDGPRTGRSDDPVARYAAADLWYLQPARSSRGRRAPRGERGGGGPGRARRRRGWCGGRPRPLRCLRIRGPL